MILTKVGEYSSARASERVCDVADSTQTSMLVLLKRPRLEMKNTRI